MISRDIDAAVQRLVQHDVVAIPTETVYGLAASIHSDQALRKVFTTKDRPFFDPLIVHISNLEQRLEVVDRWPLLAQFLATHFWPGPLTMVLPKTRGLNPLITSGLETVGIRMPSHPMAQALINRLGCPVAAPSANKFGKTSPTSAEHVEADFKNENLFILDGGFCEVGVESTVARVVGESRIEILRPGAVSEESIRKLTRKEWPDSVEVVRLTSAKDAPGQLEHHYQPLIPLILLETRSRLTEEMRNYISRKLQRSAREYVELQLPDDPRLAARQLYSEMRELSKAGADFMLVTRHAHQKGEGWTAVWDRVEKASSLRV